MDSQRIDPIKVQKTLFKVILKRGAQCMSRASLSTGYGVSALNTALEVLLERKLVRPAADQGDRSGEFQAYEANI